MLLWWGCICTPSNCELKQTIKRGIPLWKTRNWDSTNQNGTFTLKPRTFHQEMWLFYEKKRTFTDHETAQNGNFTKKVSKRWDLEISIKAGDDCHRGDGFLCLIYPRVTHCIGKRWNEKMEVFCSRFINEHHLLQWWIFVLPPFIFSHTPWPRIWDHPVAVTG